MFNKALKYSILFLLFFSLTFSGVLNAQSSNILTDYLTTGEEVLYQLEIIESTDLALESNISQSEFADYLKNAVPSFQIEGVPDTTLTAAVAARLSVMAVGQKEFAMTYPNRLSDSEKYWQAAEDIGVFDKIPYKLYAADKLTQSEVIPILIEVLEQTGQYEQSFGKVSSKNIYGKAVKAREEIDPVQIKKEASELFELGTKGLTEIEGGIFTGYVIKDYHKTPIYNFDNTIWYNHSSTEHLKQLISLLKREDISVELKVVPRISSYVHLIDEWGPPSEEAVLTEINKDRAVVHENGYDVVLEFDYQNDLKHFDELIKRYAKRTEEDTSGLIADPWYSPVYVSLTKRPGYEAVGEIRVNNDGYYLYSFVLNEYAEKAAERLSEISTDDLEVELSQVYVNQAFVEYLESNLE